MRKILSLLMLFCMFVGTAWAQDPTAINFSEFNAEKLYRIYNQKTGESIKALVVNNSNKGALSDYNKESNDQLWLIIPGSGDNEGKYLFYNPSTGKYLRGVQGNAGVEATANRNEAVYYTATIKDTYKVKFSCGNDKKNTLWNDGNNNLYGWADEGTDQEYFSLEESGLVYVTFNYFDGDLQFASKNLICEANAEITLANVPAYDFFDNKEFKSSGELVASMGASFDINCTPNFPFEPAIINANGQIEGKWYKLIQGDKKIAYTYAGNGEANSGSEDDTHRVDFVTDNNNAKGYWAFVRVPGTIKFNVYNLGRPGVPMAAVKHASQSNKENYNWGMLYMDYKQGSITDFVISKNGENFNIQIPADQINNNNATCGDHINGHFGFWSAGGSAPITAGGSKLAVEEVEVTELEEAKSNAKAVWSATSWGSGFPNFATKVGTNEVNSLETFDAVIDAATTEEEIEDALEAMRTNINEYYVRMYNVGYFAKHREKRYLSTGVENDNKGTVATVKDGDANSWFIYSFDGKLQQENTAKYVVCGNGVGDPWCNESYYKFTDNAADASAFVFSSTATEGQYRIYDSNGAMCSWESNREYRVFSIDTKENWSEWAVELSPLKGGFYRLKASDNTYLSNTLETGGTIQTTADQDVSTIYYLERGNEAAHYYLVNYQNGHYIANPWRIGVGEAKIPEDEEVYKQYMAISKNANGKYLLNYANGSDNFLKAQDSQTTYSTDAADSGVQWTFEQVTALPVTVTAAKYATFYAPVAVQVEEGVTANTVAVYGNVATLTAIDGGVIPANTGVILNGEAGTYNFAITTATNTIESGLKGTVEAAYVTDDAYVLANGDNGVGLYKAEKNQQEGTSWLNNGFKAYLPASAVTAAGARFISFDFGTETAIDELNGENGNVKTVIYDLAGRRVQGAQKGIFIVNGKKVVK